MRLKRKWRLVGFIYIGREGGGDLWEGKIVISQECVLVGDVNF